VTRHKTPTAKQEEKEMVAFMAAVDKMPQADIAKTLKLTKATVCRYIRAAKEERPVLLRDLGFEFVERSKQRRDAIRQRIQQRLYPSALCAALNQIACQPIRRVSVFDSAPGANSGELKPWDHAAWKFGRAAAGRIREIVMEAGTVYCAFGRQLLAVVDGIRRLGLATPWTKKRIQFVPVWGEVLTDARAEATSPSFPEPERFSASFIAAELSRLANGPREPVYSLLAAPAIIPRGFPPADIDCIKRFIHKNKAYAEIFGDSGHDGLLHDKPDTLLAGAGVPQHKGRFWSAAIMHAIDVRQEDMEKLVVGDSGGVLIERPGLSHSEQQQLQEIQSHWLGLHKDHLKYIADNARTGGHGGVTVVGVGKLRATVIFEAIKSHGGLINELVIDRALADELARLLKQRDSACCL